MDDKEQSEILENVLSKYKLKEHQIRMIKNNYWLGASPTSNKKSEK